MAAELETALDDLARRFGPAVLDDADGLGPLLDDFVVDRHEQVRARVVVDAVRLQSWQRLRDLRAHGAASDAALDSAAAHLVEVRGGTDPGSAREALAALAGAAGVLADPVATPAETEQPRLDPPPGTTAVPPQSTQPATSPVTPGTEPSHWHRSAADWPAAAHSADTAGLDSRRGRSRRVWAAVAGALVAATVAGVLLATGLSGEPAADADSGTGAGTDDQQEGEAAGDTQSDGGQQQTGAGDIDLVADEYAGLGAWSITESLSCRESAARRGERDALSCRLADVEMRLATHATPAAVAADREQWARRVRNQPGTVMTRTPAAMVVHDPATGTIYWDSAADAQSSVLRYGRSVAADPLFAQIDPPLPLPDPPGLLPSTELLDFAPAATRARSCRPDPAVPPGPDEIAMLYCPLGDGYVVRLAEVYDRATLRLERLDVQQGTRPEPGTVRPGVWFADASARRPSGSIIEFIHGGGVLHPEDAGEARLYWDDASCLCWGVLWAPDGDQTALRERWLDGSRTALLE